MFFRTSLNVSRFLLCLFLLFFPFQIRTLVYQSQLFFSGQFNIYSSFFIHAADIFLLLAFLFWGISCFQRKEKFSLNFGEEKFTLLLVILLGLMLITTIFAEDKLLHLLLFFRFASLFLFYLMMINEVISLKLVICLFVAGMAFQALTAVFQYVLQGPVGLRFFGEPAMTAQTLGTAKIEIDAQKILRTFGTFPHANILGGALFMAIILVFGWFRRHSWIYWPLVLFLGAALLLTFSRSAFFALAAAFLIYICLDNRKIALRTILFVLTLVLFFVIAIGLEDVFLKRLLFENTAALRERNLYLYASVAMLLNNPLGVGLGGFTAKMQHFLNAKLMPWQHQPVHNIFLLAANEIGLAGGIIFLLLFGFIFYFLMKRHRQFHAPLDRHCLASLLGMTGGIVITGLFDHYFFSLYPGQVMLFIYFALAGGILSKPLLPAKNS